MFYENGRLRDHQYRYCFLWHKGKRKYFSIHRLVALLHLPLPNGDLARYVVHHKDSDVACNHADKLQWCTEKEHTEIHKNDPNFTAYDPFDEPWNDQF